MNGWALPREAVIGGKPYPIHGDFRDILEIFSYLDDRELPEFIRWEIALALFYEGQIPPEDTRQAMEFLAEFLCCGRKETSPSGHRLLDWQQDAELIVADVNKVAGTEIRALPFVHWWTFLGWFNAIGQGQLSTVVAIRDKLRRGKKLERWEQDYYRANKARIELKPQYTPQELREQERIKAMLDGK